MQPTKWKPLSTRARGFLESQIRTSADNVKFVTGLLDDFGRASILNVFKARRTHQGTAEEEDVIALGSDDLIIFICCHIPDLDVDPDMAQRGEERGMTHLLPNEPRDLMTIDYTLIKSVIDKETGTRRTIIALAYIAFLLCHGLAHVLEFRSIRIAQFRDDGGAFETPPGITGTEAGTS